MKITRITGILAVAAVAAAGCEDITNPIEEQGELLGPYVRFEETSLIAGPATTNRVIVQMPTRVDEDVIIQYGFSGDAVYGEDFVIVDQEGNIRSDASAAGVVGVIEYDFEREAFSRDTVFVQTTFDAVDGRELEIEILDAVTESGRQVLAGIREEWRTFVVNIEGFVDIPTGTYVGEHTGFAGPTAQTVTVSAEDVVVDGTPFSFVISDFGALLFGGPVPLAFNVTSGGSVLAAPYSHVYPTLGADVTGSYDFDENRLILDVDYAPGIAWRIDVTFEDS